MFKKMIKYIIYIFIFTYIISAPFYLNNVYSEKYLTDNTVNDWSGVISMWDIPRLTVNGSEFGWVKERIAKYHKLNPKVHIELRELHYNDNKDIAFRAALSEDHPDIMPLFIEGEILPLDNVSPVDFFDQDNSIISIKDELIGTVFKDEKIWGIPFCYSVNVLIVNKDILSSLEVKIPEELNFDNFFALLDNINKRDNNNEIIPYDFYSGGASSAVIPFLLSEGGNVFSGETGNINFYTPEAISGLQKLITIKNTIKNLPEDFGTRTRAQTINDFLDKKTAIISGNLSDINSVIRKNNRGNGFEYLALPYPKGKNEMNIVFADSVECYGIMKTNDKGKQQAIYDFMKFLLGEDSQKSVEILGKLPSVLGYSYHFEQYPHLNSLNNQNFLHIIPFYLDRKLVNDTIDTEIEKLFNSNQAITDTLYNIQQTAGKILQNTK